MRSLLTRLAALSVVTVAIAGCAGSSGTAIPVAGVPAGGQAGAGNAQTVYNQPGGTGGVVVPPGTIPSKLLDDGTLASTSTTPPPLDGPLVAVTGGTATDSQSPLQAPQDATAPAPSQAPPLNPSGATDGGSHLAAVTGNNSATLLLTTNKSTGLTYTFGGQTFTYSAIIVHAYATGFAGNVPSLLMEIAGSAGPSAYDVRFGCTPTTPLGATFATYRCALPAYGTTTNNTVGPSYINPGTTGAFTPNAGARVYYVLNFPSATTAATIGNFGLDYVYAVQ